jgi:hypothetical protein
MVFGLFTSNYSESFFLNKKSSMKKTFVLLATALVITSVSFAQPGGFQRRTPEERAAAIHAKLDSAFKLDPAKLAALDTALIVLYKAQNTKMDELRSASERPDRETMMAEMKKFTDARDEMLKSVLTEEQFVIWRDKIEPSMRPQRPPGGGGRPGNK